MRRALVVVVALAGMAAAGVAYAATGPYSGGLVFRSSRAGTVAKPVATGFTLGLKAVAPAGLRPPVQLDVKVKIYGMTEDGADFPTCSLARIAAAKNDNVCPKGAEVATGSLDSTLGSSQDFSKPGSACDPVLDVWNSGQGKTTYFFVTTAQHQCLGGALHTGGTPPYAGTYQRVGNYLVTNVSVPKVIDYPLAGLAGSMQSERLVFVAHTVIHHGRRLESLASIGCLKGKRPYSITTTWASPQQGTHTQTITGAGRC